MYLHHLVIPHHVFALFIYIYLLYITYILHIYLVAETIILSFCNPHLKNAEDHKESTQLTIANSNVAHDYKQ